MYDFVSKTFPQKISNIEKELKTVNVSNKNIESMVSQITPTESVAEISMINRRYLLEEESEKVEFKDDEKSSNNTTLVHHVTTYLKVSSDILSAKMKCFRDIYALYMRTIKHYIKPAPEPKPEEKETNTKTTDTTIDV